MVPDVTKLGSRAEAAVAVAPSAHAAGAAPTSSATGDPTPDIGFAAAVLAAALTAVFIVLAILAVDTDPWSGIEAHAETFRELHALQLVPVLLLAPVVVVLMAAIREVAPEPGRIFAQVALVFAGAYAGVIVTNYIVQLYVVRLNLSSGELEGLALLAMANPRSIFVALEITGYAFFSLAAGSASAAFTGAGGAAWIRRLLLACGTTGIVGATGALVDQSILMLAGFGLSLLAFFLAMPLVAIHFRALARAGS